MATRYCDQQPFSFLSMAHDAWCTNSRHRAFFLHLFGRTLIIWIRNGRPKRFFFGYCSDMMRRSKRRWGRTRSESFFFRFLFGRMAACLLFISSLSTSTTARDVCDLDTRYFHFYLLLFTSMILRFCINHFYVLVFVLKQHIPIVR
jgi:hypothetical protein